MRVTRLGIALVLAAVLLTGCTTTADGAVRLNSDGTVDYLLCDASLSSVRVDYMRSGDRWDNTPEWEADSQSPLQKHWIDVAYYGEVPDDWAVTISAVEAPADWVAIIASGLYAEREDLREGEWIWTASRFWSWEGDDRPCEGWELGSDGEPRRV